MRSVHDAGTLAEGVARFIGIEKIHRATAAFTSPRGGEVD
jgi:hypothetical protein